MDGYNKERRARVADLLSDFTQLQQYIAAAPDTPEDMDDYYTEGWKVLRQCSIDGQHILNCGADTTVPRTRGGQEEQDKAELQQVHLDVFSRRHMAQKIYLRQAAAQDWISNRDYVLQGERPHSGHELQLQACDQELVRRLATITDDAVYQTLQASDIQYGRWIGEDPSVRAVQRWVRSRRST
ncbi:hypothetical protein RB595_008322 [Gaeumannomyces hyphopodioides]